MGDVGAVATLLNTIASWVLSDEGYAEWALKRYVKGIENDAITAIRSKDFTAADQHIARLKRVSEQP